MLRKVIGKSIFYNLKSIIRKGSLCLLSALLLVLAFSFSRYWPLAWFGFVPLFIALNKQNLRKAFLIAYFTGVIFWAGTIYWLINVTLLGQIILILYLALYFGLFGCILSFAYTYILNTTYYLLFTASLWVVLEYLRTHLLTGFPWALLGYSQYTNLAVIQIADIAGVWLVSFLVILVNASLYSIVSTRRSTRAARIRYLWLPILCIIFSLVYGYHRLYQAPGLKFQAPIRISVIQGNIPQELKWDTGSRDFVMERYFKLTSEAEKESQDLVIWPEASLPVVLEEEPLYYERLLRYVKTSGKPLLFGAVTTRSGLYYNSALLLSKEAKLTQSYDKLHLVPFGEYIPFRSAFPLLETIVPIGDIAAGKGYTLFDIQPASSKTIYRFGVLICFEDVFPSLSRSFVRKGADFMVNITNDAWFGKTTEAYQHLAASVFRAVENRVYLVRVANTGVSGFINPKGEILSLVNDGQGNVIFIPGYLTQDISPFVQPTFYARYGDLLVFVFLLYLLIIMLSLRLKGKH